jgi:hypothetical protein
MSEDQIALLEGLIVDYRETGLFSHDQIARLVKHAAERFPPPPPAPTTVDVQNFLRRARLA